MTRRVSLVQVLVVAIVLGGVAGSASLAAQARDAGHWAFRVSAPGTPPVEHGGAGIDAFVRARWVARGVDGSPPADPATFARRLALDLTGLPPDPERLASYLAAPTPAAERRYVDALLESPHFAERWARHWLDLARYADSDGYEKDNVRPHAWRYRDWVLASIERDQPYDAFLVEQLAGDLLPNATDAQRTATGFHRQTLTNREGGVDQEEFRCKAVVDRVNTTGAAILGLTLGCAECHDHKYDPISQREYYELFAFFDTADERDVDVDPTPAELAAWRSARRAHDERTRDLEAALEAAREGLDARLDAWLAARPAAAGTWHVLVPVGAVSERGARLDIHEDGVVSATGHAPARDTYTITYRTSLTGITALRLDALPHRSLGGGGPGRTRHGNFVVQDVEVLVHDTDGDLDPDRVPFADARATHSQARFDVGRAIDDDARSGWAVAPRYGHEQSAVFLADAAFGRQDGATVTVRVRQEYGTRHVLGRFRFVARTGDVPIGSPLPGTVALALQSPDASSRVVLREWFEGVDAETRGPAAALREHRAARPRRPRAKAMVLAETAPHRATHVHVRGDFLTKGERVTPGTPAVLPPLQPRGERPDRLDLARWLVDSRHPLTARVAVNQIWRHLFGAGLVRSVGDFGTRGDEPTHPRLLDWLARRFVDVHGWSRKALIREIVASTTYRQSSAWRADLASRDPENRWLARQRRFRIDAELVRDLSLAAAGLLARDVGGPSVRPPLPAGVSDLGYARSVKWRDSDGAARYRRGLYVHFQRTVPYPMLMTFDAPDANVTCVERTRSNSPLQALTTWNDPVFVECARAFASRVLRLDEPDDAGRLAAMVRIALGRALRDDERDVLLAFVVRQRAQFAQQPSAARALLARAVVEAGAGSAGARDEVEWATWTAVARVVLNLDEFLTRS